MSCNKKFFLRLSQWKSFFLSPLGGGVLLFLASFAGFLCANSPLAPVYQKIIESESLFGWAGLHASFEELVSLGPMSLFFMLVTLEIKKEILSGHLSSLRLALLPIISAFGGVLVPALIFLALCHGEPQALKGWAIPIATDAAFTLPIMLALARHVSDGARIWLMALAVFDDIVGIIIIAVCYSGTLDMTALIVALGITLCLTGMNKAGIKSLWAYMGTGCALWGALLVSGVHPTVSGVVTALCLPCDRREGSTSPLHKMEHILFPWVTLLIMPLFGFVSVGVSLRVMNVNMILTPVTLAVMAGLVIGKPVGVFGITWLAVKMRIAHLPTNSSFGMIFGLSLLCGIGFTISLFIANLSFQSQDLMTQARFAILVSSLIAAMMGTVWLKRTPSCESK